MLEQDFVIRNRTGLHARPAARFVKEAGTYQSSIVVFHKDKKADAKSVIGLLSLGIVQGATIRLQASGPDEAQAIAGLGTLIKALVREEG